MSNHVVGSCSICGGRVSIPNVWYGVNPPTPTCESCGAVAKGTTKVVEIVKEKLPEPSPNIRHQYIRPELSGAPDETWKL